MEELRERLDKSVEMKGVSHQEVIKVSAGLDEVIVKYCKEAIYEKKLDSIEKNIYRNINFSTRFFWGFIFYNKYKVKTTTSFHSG